MARHWDTAGMGSLGAGLCTGKTAWGWWHPGSCCMLQDAALQLTAAIPLQQSLTANRGMLSQWGLFAQTGQSIQLGNGRGLNFQPQSCCCSLWKREPGTAHKQDYCTVPFLYTAQLFEQPEIGSPIRWAHGIHPKWKCFHPPAPMVSVLSNSNLTNTQVMNEQMPRLRTGPNLCLPKTASLLPPHPVQSLPTTRM